MALYFAHQDEEEPHLHLWMGGSEAAVELGADTGNGKVSFFYAKPPDLTPQTRRSFRRRGCRDGRKSCPRLLEPQIPKSSVNSMLRKHGLVFLTHTNNSQGNLPDAEGVHATALHRCRHYPPLLFSD